MSNDTRDWSVPGPGSLQSASFIGAIGQNVHTNLVAAVAGQAITVYGWFGSIGPDTPATLGFYDVVLADDNGANIVGSMAIQVATAVGELTVPYSVSLPYGKRLPLGSNLKLSTEPPASLPPGTTRLQVVVFFTQE